MKTIRKFLLDMLPVVLGVLLALFINNLNESVRQEQKISEISDLLMAEILCNYNDCKEFVEEQKARNDFFSIYLDSINAFSDRGLFFMQMPYKGQRIVSLSQTAWDAAQYSGILSSIDLEELQNLTAIYQRQVFLMDVQKQIVSKIYSQDVYNANLLESTFYYIQLLNEDFLTFANSLIFNYEYYLRLHGQIK